MNTLRILYDDFDQKVKNIHDEMDLHHSYKKKRVLHLRRKQMHSVKRDNRDNRDNFYSYS